MELEQSAVDNLYDAVRHLRPDWFRRSRAGSSRTINVYLDDRQLGDLGVLRSFGVTSVSEVRYLGTTEAQVRYGTLNRGRAAISLTSARR